MSLVPGHPDYDISERYNWLLADAQNTIKQSYLTILFDDFIDDPSSYGNSTKWNPGSQNTNSFSFIAGDEAGGSLIMSTGATANSLVGLAPGNSVAGTPYTVATSTPGKAFYLAAKFKIPTTPDAQTKTYIGFTDTTNTLLFGVFGGNSTTLFTLQHSANEATTFANFTPAVDTNYHTVKMWSNGQDGVVRCQMDYDNASLATNVVAVTPTVTYAKLRLWTRARNVGTAADQRLQLAWLFVAAQP